MKWPVFHCMLCPSLCPRIPPYLVSAQAFLGFLAFNFIHVIAEKKIILLAKFCVSPKNLYKVSICSLYIKYVA